MKHILVLALCLSLLIPAGCGPVDKDNEEPDTGFINDPYLSYQETNVSEFLIERTPSANTFRRQYTDSLPSYTEDPDNAFVLMLETHDLSDLDLSDRADDLLQSTFSSHTVWPELPPEFDPDYILDMARNPGLGLRDLHSQGYDGSGIGVGIIDSTLLVDHQEYADNIQMYHEMNIDSSLLQARSHATIVTSVIAGENSGVAPGVDVYYIAAGSTRYNPNFGDDGGYEADHRWRASAIRRLLSVNELLPPENRIRVISVSAASAPKPGHVGYDEYIAAIGEAQEQGVWVVSGNLFESHGFHFRGLDRDLNADIDAAENYTPFTYGHWFGLVDGHYEFIDHARADYDRYDGEVLLVPNGRYSLANMSGAEDYIYWSFGGWSWAIPWISGLYALASQVAPNITPDSFWEAALTTGIRTELDDGRVGKIVAPARLIEYLQQ